MSFNDAVVIGAGTAGLVAAVRLAEATRRVAVVAKGAGSTRVAPGTIDVLGYDPDRVDRPAEALPSFVAARPGHPYARVGAVRLAAAVAWLRERGTAYRYVGSLEENLLLPTALGAAKPSAVVPATMAGGDLRGGGSFLLCGLRGFKDFFPALAADNLRATANVWTRAAELTPPTGGESDLGALAWARRFEDLEFRRAVTREVLAALEGEDGVGFPAVLGLSRAAEVWTALQDALGRLVFEIPTLPPSVPGVRLWAALTDDLRRAGGRLIMGSEVVGARTAGRRVEAVIVRTAARDVELEARWIILATGGLLSGGIEVASDGGVRETVLGLPVSGVPDAGEPFFSPEYFGPHPLAGAGLATDSALRPLDRDGSVVYENVFAAGAVLGGAEPWREKSGEGISLGTGFAAAGEILEREGSDP